MNFILYKYLYINIKNIITLTIELIKKRVAFLRYSIDLFLLFVFKNGYKKYNIWANRKKHINYFNNNIIKIIHKYSNNYNWHSFN